MAKGHIKRGIIGIKILLISFYVGYKFFDNSNTQLQTPGFETERPFEIFQTQAQTANDCGNGYCDGVENANTCPTDCGCNFNNICEVNRGEDFNNCVNDCTPPAEISCTDGIDNDLDGNIDCADSDCNGDVGPNGVICQSAENFCADGYDNDGDGDIDCEDSNCSTENHCIPVCGDGIWDQETEQCDDGNSTNQDGCSNTCQWEAPECNINMFLGAGFNSSTLTIQSVGPQSNRIDIYRLDWGDGSNTSSFVYPAVSHQYSSTGTYTVSVGLQSVRTGGYQTECTNTITINSLRGCTDSRAINYKESATANDGSCIYSPFPEFTCESLNLTVTKNDTQGSSGSTNEEVIIKRDHDPIKYMNIDYFDGISNTTQNISNPHIHNYSEAGSYEAKLLITHENGDNYICSSKVHIGKHGCTYSIADNFDPDASINDGSCIFSAGNGYVDIQTSQPYLEGGSIYGQIAYSHDANRINIMATLSQSGNVKYEFTPQLYQNGLFFIPIDYETIEANYITPGNYNLFVKADHYKGASDTRLYTNIKIQKPVICGNNTLEGEEECDDGNTVSGDGCHANCKLNICGDGITNLFSSSGSNSIIEECDDGNTNTNDGCNALCQWEVENNKSEEKEETEDIEETVEKIIKRSEDHTIADILITIPYCGNTIIEGEEECDGGAHCTSSCTLSSKSNTHSSNTSILQAQKSIAPIAGLNFEQKKRIRALADEQVTLHTTYDDKKQAIETYKERVQELLESNVDHKTTLHMYTLRTYTIAQLEKEITGLQTAQGK